MTDVLLETNLPAPRYQGKVRDTYDLGDRLLIVATDRVSAFDVVMSRGIPDKGAVLTQLSAFWFEKIGPTKLIEDVGVNNVLIETDVPHPVCFYPNPRERLMEATASWDAHTRRRVLQENAVELYSIPIPAGV